jgi:uncharacterized protein with beta-barrel porin domain
VFQVNGAKRGQDSAVASAGVEAQVSETVGVSFGYAGEVAGQAQNHQAQAGVKLNF